MRRQRSCSTRRSWDAGIASIQHKKPSKCMKASPWGTSEEVSARSVTRPPRGAMSKTGPASAWRMMEIFSRDHWQMTLGQRAALEGVLSSLKPETAVEIGTAAGGSLRSLSLHSGHVHSFDLALPPNAESFPNVTFHPGNSHETLRPWLDGFDGEIHFVLIDGDHTTEGALKDIRDVVESPSLNGVVLMHDSCNAQVHRALRSYPWSEHERVRHVDLGFLPGYVLRRGRADPGELCSGFAMAIVGDRVPVAPAFTTGGPVFDVFYDSRSVMRPAAEVLKRPRAIARQVRHPRTTIRNARWKLAQARKRSNG